jgi:hypothetical protein
MYYTCALPPYAAGMYGDDRLHINDAAVWCVEVVMLISMMTWITM